MKLSNLRNRILTNILIGGLIGGPKLSVEVYINYKHINHIKINFNILKTYLSLMKVIILLRVQGVYVKRKLKLKPLEKYSEKPVLMEVIDYFRILKTFTIMNNVQNQNEKVLEEVLTGSNSDVVKTTLRGLHNFQNDLAPFASSRKASHHSFVTLSLGVESVANGSVG